MGSAEWPYAIWCLQLPKESKGQRCGVLRARPRTPCVDKGTPVAASGSQGAVIEDQVLEVVDQLDAAIVCGVGEGWEVCGFVGREANSAQKATPMKPARHPRLNPLSSAALLLGQYRH